MSNSADVGIVGQRIKDIRPMTASEATAYAWDHDRDRAVVIVLDNGVRLIPARDPEGNGPGALFGEDSKGAFNIGVA